MRCSTPASTSDLSRGGLFVITDRPLSADRGVRLRLDLGDFEVPLRGRVAWTRLKAEPDRPVGMGVQLINPSPMYLRYVKRIEQEQPREGA